jgi:hypothetical protein
MKEIFSLISIGLYFIVGVISLYMALKSFLSKKFLPFQEEAAGIPWKKISKPLQSVILTSIKVSGLGFLVVALLLMVFPGVNYFIRDRFVEYSVPMLSFMFCFGLFLFNYHLHKNTKANTPWKNSLLAMGIIVAGFAISLFG